VNDINQDRDLDLAGFRLGLDPVDLVVVAVHQRDPGSLVLRVASLCLVEDLGHNRRGVLDH
jgi:hypothetical protein